MLAELQSTFLDGSYLWFGEFSSLSQAAAGTSRPRGLQPQLVLRRSSGCADVSGKWGHCGSNWGGWKEHFASTTGAELEDDGGATSAVLVVGDIVTLLSGDQAQGVDEIHPSGAKGVRDKVGGSPTSHSSASLDRITLKSWKDESQIEEEQCGFHLVTFTRTSGGILGVNKEARLKMSSGSGPVFHPHSPLMSEVQRIRAKGEKKSRARCWFLPSPVVMTERTRSRGEKFICEGLQKSTTLWNPFRSTADVLPCGFYRLCSHHSWVKPSQTDSEPVQIRDRNQENWL